MSIGGEFMEELYENKILPKYKDLLKSCVEAFNELPNKSLKKNSKFKSTYEIASKIDELLNDKK